MHFDKDYSKFSFEEFLQDDFFIQSMKYPTKESVAYWEQFQQRNKDRLNDFEAARQFIKAANTGKLSDDETNKIWKNIKASKKRTRRIKPTTYYIGFAAAASIALLVIFITQPHLRQLAQNEDSSSDIVSFASEYQVPADHSIDEAQLILSDDKVVLLTEQESVITYDSTAISINAQDVPKTASSAYNQLIIPRGKRSTLIFDDGTKIWVNAGTRVVYPVEFTKEKREIYVDGEVFLDVTPDKQRPFIVRTNDIDIQVLGTKFNVQAYASDAQKRIALESGSIKITSKASHNEVLLSPDKMYEFNEGKESVKNVDIRKYVSWVEGLYFYDSERLDIILARLSRYYGKDIDIDLESAKLTCSGKLDLKERLDDVLMGLSYTAPISYTHVDEKYTISFKPLN